MTRKPWGTIAVVVGVFSALMVGICSTAAAEDNHAFPFMRTGVGARAWGMGNAYVAVANDAYSPFFNPAGLSRLESWGFASMLSADMAIDRKHNYVAIGGNFKFGALGASWMNSGINDVPKTGDGSGGGTFNYTENVFTLTYANCHGSFHYGINLLIANRDLDSETKSGIGGDVGVQWDFHNEATIGASAQHLGLKVGEDDVPANIRMGIAVHPEMMNGFTFPLEIQKTQDRDHITFRMGGEYAYDFDSEDYGAAVRAGVDDGAFSIGAGLRFLSFWLDYAYVSEQEDFLDENHKFSLTGNF